WRNPDVYRTLGLVAEREAVHGFLTAWEFVLASARLHRLPDPAAAARRAIDLVDMREAQDRRMQTFSKGMRQRTRVAAALVHEPHVCAIRSTDDRRLAVALVAEDSVAGLDVGTTGLTVRAGDYGAFTRALPKIALREGVRVRQLIPSDESLESVFSYLVAT